MRFTIFLAACLCLPFEAVAPPASSQQSSRPGWPCAGKVDPVYVTTAEATGGKVMLFHPTEAEGGARYPRLREHDETVCAAGQLAEERMSSLIPTIRPSRAYFSYQTNACRQALMTLDRAVTGTAGGYHQFEAVRLFVAPAGAGREGHRGRARFFSRSTAQSDSA